MNSIIRNLFALLIASFCCWTTTQLNSATPPDNDPNEDPGIREFVDLTIRYTIDKPEEIAAKLTGIELDQINPKKVKKAIALQVTILTRQDLIKKTNEEKYSKGLTELQRLQQKCYNLNDENIRGMLLAAFEDASMYYYSSKFKPAIGDQDRTPSFTELMLLKAAAKDYIEDLPKLISTKGIYLNVTDEEGLTPLMHTIANHNTQAAMALIVAGADVNKPDKHGNTPFMAACFTGNLGIANLLKEFKADMNKKNKQGLTAHDIIIRQQSYFDSHKNATKVDSFSGKTTDGKIIDYAQYRGKKAVLIYFIRFTGYVRYAQHNKKEVLYIDPEFQKILVFRNELEKKLIGIYESYPHDKIEILSVYQVYNLSGDFLTLSYGQLRKYKLLSRLPFPAFFDPSMGINHTIQPQEYPYVVLIDKYGNIVYRGKDIPDDGKIKECVYKP
jgi:hypothetical protein